MKLKNLAAVLLTGLLAGGCGNESPAPSSGALEGDWRLLAVRQDGKATLVPEPEHFTVRFESDGQLSIQADCNACTGRYRAEDSLLDVDDRILCTRVACSSSPLDHVFVRLLAESNNWSSDGSELRIESQEGTLHFFRP